MSRLEWLRLAMLESGGALWKLPKSLTQSRLRRMKAHRPSLVEALEDRTLLTNYIVNTTSDDADDAAGVADGLLSLREAIVAANTNAAFGDAPAGMAGGDTIRFDTSVFTGSDAARTISLQNGPLIITDDVRITGVADDVILDGGGTDRILRIASSEQVVITDFALINGQSTDGAGGGALRLTGGGRTVLGRVTISNSSAVGRGGGILSIASTLETFDSQILNNTAGTGAGIASVSGVVTLNQTLVEGNIAVGEGGGLSNDAGRLILRDSVVSANTANASAGVRGGGGIQNTNNGRLAINDSEVVSNAATNALGGGIFSASGEVTIGTSTISDNFAARAGGGIEIFNGSLVLLSSTIGGVGTGAGNIAGAPASLVKGNGGGIHIGNAARVEVEDSRIQFNQATGEGGGIWNAPQSTLIVRGGSRPVVATTADVVTLDPTVDPSFQAAVDAFRATLGADNGGVPGSQGSGRREINWDGVPGSLASPNQLPPDLFNQAFDPLARGVELSTPGSQFQVSATNASSVGTFFSNFNPNYAQTFTSFSPERLFTPVGSNITVVDFFIPGTNTPALVQGFGAIFTDVDLADTTTIEYFDKDGRLLLEQAATAIDAQASLSFVGATFSFPAVAQVRITAGNGTLGLKDISQNGPTDVVVVDDFIFGEPVTLESVATETLIQGNIASGDDADQGGGGIYNNGGRLAVVDATISDNLADGVNGSGGGILSTSGMVTIVDSIVSGNESQRAGGGIEVVAGMALLTDVTLGGPNVQDGNSTGLLPFGLPSPGNGGGLHVSNQSFVRITRGSVQNNLAAQEGGGLWNAPSSVMVIDGTDIADNTAMGDKADDGGGGIFNLAGRLIVSNATISGNSAIGLSGSGGGLLNQGGAVTLTDITFDNNDANRAGGGIEVRGGLNVLDGVDLIANRAGNGPFGNPGNGGGLHVTGASRVDIFGGVIQDNTAAQEGGGLWNSAQGLMILHGGTAIRNNIAFGTNIMDGGGGIFNDGGRLAIAGAEISGNIAAGGGTTGGGLLSVAGPVTIENSTISGNQSNSAGGGIANFGRLLLTNNTIVLNVSNPDGTRIDGGGIFTAAGAFTGLRNTIVAGNRSVTQTRSRPRESDLGGPGSLGSSGFNLIGDANSAGGLMNAVNGNIVGMQGEGTISLMTILDRNLADNGGTTRTHALTFSSLALNNGNNSLAVNSAGAPLTTDQRGVGFPRIFNSTVDIGAFER